MRFKPRYFILFLLLACQSKKSPETSIQTNTSDSTSKQDFFVKTAKESSSMAWLQKQKAVLDSQYNSITDFEKRLEFLKAFERQMSDYLDKKNRILDSVSVDVEKIDSMMPSIINIHLSNPLVEYFQSTGTDDSNNRATINKVLKKLNGNSPALVHFKVESIKVNDPTIPLAPFEINGNILVDDSLFKK